ncbi:hypothetical protein OHA77_39775 [Streptosporangium sp. NBC_01639]|nr:hypothetical protein OHA77_39775 [Streptosporangium sp. NBC_01639]
MSSFTLSVRIPGEWGRYVRTVVITIVILVLAALGAEIHLPLGTGL